MKRIMTDGQNELITQNINLARYMAGKYKNLPMDPEELLAQAFLGLTKAAVHYQTGGSASFATFACTVMANEILIAWRREKKHLGIASLDVVHTDMDGNEFTLKDLLSGPEDAYDYVNSLNTMRSQIKRLAPTERRLFDLLIKHPGRRQVEYGRMMGMSQSYLSRVMRRIYKKLRG